jgi:hypothetical protein
MLLLAHALIPLAAAWDHVVDLPTDRPVDPNVYEALLEDAAGRSPAGARHVRLVARAPDGRLVPVEALLPPRARQPPAESPSPPPTGPTADLPGPGFGALAGKAVYISQCHGWVWQSGLGDFSTQRGNLFDTVEDLHNPEGTNHYLVRYLEAAGARVFTVKERDPTVQMYIADDDGDGYTESGSGWRDGAAGFANEPPWDYGDNPFRAGGTRRAPEGSGAVARWIPEIDQAGTYAVYVSWETDAEHSPSAHYRLRHPGGEIDRWFDQRVHGSTWQYLETLWLPAGTPLTIELIADGAADGSWVSADAVRVGGGMGDVRRYGELTGRPRWEEAAIQAVQWNGAPESIYDPYGDGNGSDPSARSLWAAWEHPRGEDAVYLSWHSNAGGGVGTSVYTYEGSSGPAVDGSEELGDLVQAELVASFRSRWSSTWADRGRRTAAFAEVSPGLNDEMPAILVELAFHDDATDASYLKDPTFRRDASRAMARGIIRYFAERDGVDPEYPPEPPVDLAVVHGADGALELSWSEGESGGVLGDRAAAYRVYTSADGRSWDNGADVEGTSLRLRPAFGDELYVRVTAVNDGGESLPTEILGARRSPDAAPPVLVVSAYDRFQASQLPWEYDVPRLGDLRRFHPDRINPYDAVAAHGRAITAAGWYFDAVSDERLPELDLRRYRAIVWIAGEESSTDESFSTAQQELLAAYIADGGRLIASGSEILWDLDTLGSTADRAFAADVLGATLEEDDAGTEQVDGEGLLAGIPLHFGEADGAPYPNEYPDVLRSPHAVIARYDGGAVAAVLSETAALFGFPLDCVADEEARADAVGAVLAALVPDWTPPELPDGDTGEADPDSGGGGADGAAEGGDPRPDSGAADGGAAGGAAPGDPTSGKNLGCGCASAAFPGAGALLPALVGLIGLGRRRAARA